MSTKETLMQRSNAQCEICKSPDGLIIYDAFEIEADELAGKAIVCATCQEQLTNTTALNNNHWRCLSDSMWSQTPAMQVIAWRMLTKLSSETWAQDLLDMLYLDEATLALAKTQIDTTLLDNTPTLDCNGVELQKGDTVTINKDLAVKGTGFTAKRGTAVRNISLTSNPEQIEGRVNGTRIVLLTCYLKKSN